MKTNWEKKGARDVVPVTHHESISPPYPPPLSSVALQGAKEEAPLNQAQSSQVKPFLSIAFQVKDRLR